MHTNYLKNPMKITLSIILFLLAAAIIAFAYLGSLKLKKEGFQSHAFASCLNGGFSKEFCLQNPPMPGQCQCRNGAMGTFQSGFKGRCVCNN